MTSKKKKKKKKRERRARMLVEETLYCTSTFFYRQMLKWTALTACQTSRKIIMPNAKNQTNTTKRDDTTYDADDDLYAVR